MTTTPTPDPRRAELADLLREARDNCQASCVEDGISGVRREYRYALTKRLDLAFQSLCSPASPPEPPASPPPAPVTPWMVDVAHAIIRKIYPQVAAMRDNPEWHPSMYASRFDDVIELLSRHAPAAAPDERVAVLEADFATIGGMAGVLHRDRELVQLRTALAAAQADTTEAEILAFATAQWGQKDLQGIGLKLGEEAGEIAGALVKIPEGRATFDDLHKELGDILIVLSQLAAKQHTTLNALRAARFTQIKQRAATPPSAKEGEKTL